MTQEVELWLRDFSPDILHKIKRKRKNKAIRIILFDLLLAVGIFMSRSAFARKPFELAVYITVGVLILVMPLLVTPSVVLFSRPWIGRIEGMEIHSQTIVGRSAKMRYYGRRATVSTYRMNEVVYVSYDILDEKGKHRSISMPARYAPCFQKGDRIIVLAELEHPINMMNRAGSKYLCPVCGSIMH
ncbi:MAG: hypothetical protein IJX80_01730, partial [Clostridia bacterium]|nr:hypothetical protein [Clostridia bacterium]